MTLPIAQPQSITAALAATRQSMAAAGHCLDVAQHASNEPAVRVHRKALTDYQQQIQRLQRFLQQPKRKTA